MLFSFPSYLPLQTTYRKLVHHEFFFNIKCTGGSFLQHLVLFMIFINSEPRFTDSNDVMGCIDEEKEALLTFKRSPMDESGVSSSSGPENE